MKMIVLFGMEILLAFGLQAQSSARAIESKSRAKNPIELKRGQRQLFMDDYMIERIDGLSRVVNQPEKHHQNPVVYPDKPWEDRCQVYGTALFDDERGIFRLWYLTTPRDRGNRPLKLNDHVPWHTTELSLC